jgi:hypothetical protein
VGLGISKRGNKKYEEQGRYMQVCMSPNGGQVKNRINRKDIKIKRERRGELDALGVGKRNI